MIDAERNRPTLSPLKLPNLHQPQISHRDGGAWVVFRRGESPVPVRKAILSALIWMEPWRRSEPTATVHHIRLASRFPKCSKRYKTFLRQELRW
jgi:hypothetical protein